MGSTTATGTGPAPVPSRIGDVWGGIAATLVALPASLAFGVAVYSPVAGAGAGALAGLLGAVALGTIAPFAGGTPRLVSAPCAPAVAVMSAFALEMGRHFPGDPARVLAMMTLVALVAAALQLALGLARAGTIIKYIPYPVVTGYLSGVGVVIFLKQLPALLGLPKGITLGHGIVSPETWHWPALAVGVATIATMAVAPRLTRAVPGAIIGLGAGVVVYAGLAFGLPELRTLAGNGLVIGPLSADLSTFFEAFRTRLGALSEIHFSDVTLVLGPAATLAVVLSLDTLKTCVVVDAMTGDRHESNRELFGQGLANLGSAVIGGMPGAGTSGATLVNIASGGRTRWSAMIEGGLVLFAFLALGSVVAWAPLAALAGILIVVGFRMFDWSALGWARRRATLFDFLVVVTVIGVAVGVDLITSSAVGVALSILLFIRNEARAPVVRRKLGGNAIFSKRRRLPADREILNQHGAETLVVELQGSLFFGTTDQLRTELDGDLLTRRTIIFDLRRVDAMDLTAVHILEQMRSQLRAHGATMVFCRLPKAFAGQGDAERYLREVGLLVDSDPPMLFDQLTDALAWAEDRILAERSSPSTSRAPLTLLDLPMFQGRKPDTVQSFTACVEERSVAPGEHVFHHGDISDEIFFVRAGSVRIAIPVGKSSLHVASFGRGDFFGEICFLDGGARTADAVAERATELFVISRRKFDALADAHPRLSQSLFSGLARATALRLRQADQELSALEQA